MSKEPKRNVYVGHRYVPLVIGEWEKTETYEGLSIVTHKGTSYTSKKRVPKGIDILNEEYWVVTGNYNAQIEEYRKDVRNIEGQLDKKSDKSYVDDLNEEITAQLAQTKESIYTINIEDWGVLPDDSENLNSQIINSEIENLRGDIQYEIILNGVYDVSETINIENKLITFSGKGGLKATTQGITILEALNCSNITFKNITIDGNELANNGIILEKCPYFSFQNVKVVNVGNNTINNVSGILIAPECHYGEFINTSVVKIIGSSVACGIDITNFRNVKSYSKDINIKKCIINNVQPVDDGDGIKILQDGFDSRILIEETEFSQCAKRGIKVQSKGVHSKNNHFGFSDRAAIDFQTGGGFSENDTIEINGENNSYNLIGFSGDNCKVFGLRANVPKTDFGIDVTTLGGTTINSIEIKDVIINGTRQPLRFRDGVKIDKLVIEDSEFNNFTASYCGQFLNDSEVNDLTIKNTKVIEPSPYYGFISLGSALNKIENYYIVDNDIGNVLGSYFDRKNGIIRSNNDYIFEELNNRRTFESNIIPSNSTNRVFEYSKKGDVALNTNVSTITHEEGDYIIDKWVCVSDGSPTDSSKGIWASNKVFID